MSKKNNQAQGINAVAPALNAAIASNAGTPKELTIALAPLPKSAIVLDAAQDLKLVSFGQNATTLPELARFPMTQTKAGRLTGHVPNIGAYTYEKLGKAFTEAHALDLVSKGVCTVAPAVASKEEKAKMSLEIGALKRQFSLAAQGVITKLHNRQDCVISKVTATQGKDGTIRINTSAFIKTASASREEMLEQEVAQLRAKLAAVGQVVSPAKSKARARAAGQVIDIAPPVAPGNEAAPANAAPVPAGQAS